MTAPSTEKVIAINNESAATRKALDALDTLSEQWAQEVNLRGMAENMARAKDVPAAIEAIALLAWVEGAYAGRTSHQDSPRLSTPAAGEDDIERFAPKVTPNAKTGRFDYEHMAKSPDGTWVRLDDYRQLQARNAEQAELLRVREMDLREREAANTAHARRNRDLQSKLTALAAGIEGLEKRLRDSFVMIDQDETADELKALREGK